MPTTKERILVTLTPDMAKEITAIARREKTPRATVAARLMRRALEEEEDRALVTVIENRLKTTKRWLSSDEFWGEAEKLRNNQA